MSGLNITYLSFDEVPSFKGASTHILSGLREAVKRHHVQLITLGQTVLRPRPGFWHYPLAVREKNLLVRGLAFRQRTAAAVRKLRTDIVHFRSPWEGLELIRAGMPAVYEVNGLPSVELRYRYRKVPDKVWKMFRAWELECLRGAQAIICPSQRIAQFLTEICPDLEGAKIKIFPNAYDPVVARQMPAELDHGPLRVVYLGTLSHWQGLLWALKAFGEFKGRIALDIYTPAPKRDLRRAERRITRLGLEETVRLHEPLHRGQIHSVLENYHAGFAPLLKTARNSEQGSFPLKLLDYLAHGLPVIAADLFVSRQLLEHGKNSMLFHPNSMTALRETLSAALTRRGHLIEMRANCIEGLSTHWTWKDYGRELCTLYESIV